jgi:hypothetical protein
VLQWLRVDDRVSYNIGEEGEGLLTCQFDEWHRGGGTLTEERAWAVL